jgi:hypothetical protein
MTNPIVNGQMMTVGTCSCGHVFQFPWGGHEQMTAAQEAHWQSHDREHDKVDGRGQPIAQVEYLAGIAKKTKRRRKNIADVPKTCDQSPRPVRPPNPQRRGLAPFRGRRACRRYRVASGRRVHGGL